MRSPAIEANPNGDRCIMRVNEPKVESANAINLIKLSFLLIISLLFAFIIQYLGTQPNDNRSWAAANTKAPQKAPKVPVVSPTPTPTLTLQTYVFYYHSTGGYVWTNGLRHLPLRVNDLA